MCDGTINVRVHHQNPLVMTNVKSYESPTGQPPRKASAFGTGLLFLLFLILSEQSLRAFFFSIQHLHPILEDETSRFILARHVGVDFLSCFTVAVLGWYARDICHDLIKATLGGNKQAMTPGGFEQRMLTYQPASFRIALFFFVYQVKNLYDTIVWNDGPEFIFHHVASMIASWYVVYDCVYDCCHCCILPACSYSYNTLVTYYYIIIIGEQCIHRLDIFMPSFTWVSRKFPRQSFASWPTLTMNLESRDWEKPFP